MQLAETDCGIDVRTGFCFRWRQKRRRVETVAPPHVPTSETLPRSPTTSSSSDRPTNESNAIVDTTARFRRLRTQGDALAEDGRHLEALRRWSQALALTQDPLLIGILREQMAQVWMLEGQDFKACIAAEAAVDARPCWSIARLTFGRALINFGDLVGARVQLRQAFRLDQGNESIANELYRCERLLTIATSKPSESTSSSATCDPCEFSMVHETAPEPLAEETKLLLIQEELWSTRSRPLEWRRRHFRELCFAHHPDKAGETSTKAFQALQSCKEWYLA